MTILPLKATRTCQRFPRWKWQWRMSPWLWFWTWIHLFAWRRKYFQTIRVVQELDRLAQQVVSAPSPEECKQEHVGQLVIFLSPSSYCSPHDRPINRETRCWDFIQKASRPRRWWTSVPKNRLPRVRIQGSFILKGEGMWLVAANFLVSESFVLAAVHICQVMMVL